MKKSIRNISGAVAASVSILASLGFTHALAAQALPQTVILGLVAAALGLLSVRLLKLKF